MLIPVICGIGFLRPWFVKDVTYTAGPCAEDCPDIVDFSLSLGNGDESMLIAEQRIESIETNITYNNGSVAQFRSGGDIVFKPGFKALAGSRVQALIRQCNEQN